MFNIERKSMIIIGVTAIIIVLIISISVAVITHNSTGNNTTNNTTVNTTTNNTTVNATNNTTSNSTNSITSKSSSKNSKSSESSDDVHSIYEGSDEYHYSAQYGTYVKEWDDGHGNSYLKSKNGEVYEHYNNRTGFYEYNYPGEGYVHN